jgi:hypothetical protein
MQKIKKVSEAELQRELEIMYRKYYRKHYLLELDDNFNYVIYAEKLRSGKYQLWIDVPPKGVIPAWEYTHETGRPVRIFEFEGCNGNNDVEDVQKYQFAECNKNDNKCQGYYWYEGDGLEKELCYATIDDDELENKVKLHPDGQWYEWELPDDADDDIDREFQEAWDSYMDILNTINE